MKQNLDSPVKNSCEHCGRTFVRESTLFKHICEQKRRWMDIDKPANRIAFAAWSDFYSSFQPSKKKRDYKAFTQSPYYTSFVKFGGYCVDVKAVGVQAYIRYLIKGQYPIDDWTSDKIYTRFLMDYLKAEDPLDAIKRTINNIAEECEGENLEIRDFFRFGKANKICHMIISGKISPWMIYHSRTGIEFLESINDSQRSLIFPYIDPEKWMIKFRRNQTETDQVSEILKQANL